MHDGLRIKIHAFHLDYSNASSCIEHSASHTQGSLHLVYPRSIHVHTLSIQQRICAYAKKYHPKYNRILTHLINPLIDFLFTNIQYA